MNAPTGLEAGFAAPGFPAWLSDKMPIASLLAMLRFAPATTGTGFVKRYGRVELAACESMFGWSLIRSSVRRSRMPPRAAREIESPYEITLPEEMPPIELIALIYRIWAEAHPDEPACDTFLILAKAWLDYRRDVNALIPPPPTLWVAREFLRHALAWLARELDWAASDSDVRFSHSAGQLQIRSGVVEVHCPASGHWLGWSTVSARDLFRGMPKRFSGRTVVMQLRADRLLIANRYINARWHESDSDCRDDECTAKGWRQ